MVGMIRRYIIVMQMKILRNKSNETIMVNWWIALWEHGIEVLNEPADKMPHAPATIREEFKYLFATPRDTMFAVLPYFWEQMTFEVNWYTGQLLENNQKKLIVGYK
jgi:hypothetical protein